MEEPLFRSEHCPVPYVPELDFNFVSDCEILPAPEPIFDCPDIEIPLDPPQPSIPCPDIRATATGTVATGGKPCDSAAIEVNVTATRHSSCGSCSFDLDFDFNFTIPPPPVNCPELKASAQITVLPADAVPHVEVVVTRNVIASDSCGPTSCDFTFDFDFELPIPPVLCPTFDARGIVTTERGATPDVAIVVTQNTGSSGSLLYCDFDFDFDFTIPLPCPELSATGTVTAVFGSEAYVDINVTPIGDGSDCAFLFDFDFEIPQACPVLTGSATLIASEGLTPAVHLEVTKVGNDPECEYHLDFDFTLPTPPTPPCPTLTAGGGLEITATGNAPHVNVDVIQIGDDPEACAYHFDFDFEIPQAYLLGLLGSLGSDSSAGCDTECCPDIDAYGAVTVDYYGSEAYVDVTVTPSNDGEVCTYLFDFDFTLPLPSAPDGFTGSKYVAADIFCDSAGLNVTYDLEIWEHGILVDVQ